MHRTLVLPAIIALSAAISSCGSSNPPSAQVGDPGSASTSKDSQTNSMPFDLDGNGAISDEELKALLSNPNYKTTSYKISSKGNGTGVTAQATGHTCTITNIEDVNAKDPYTGRYYISVHFNVLANCDYPFSLLSGPATRSDTTLFVYQDTNVTAFSKQRAVMDAGILPRYSGHGYALSSQLRVIFTDGQTASNLFGAAAYGVAN